ncbi:MAG: S41 family peptidase [Candidatus Woykebacteria bacterium]
MEQTHTQEKKTSGQKITRFLPKLAFIAIVFVFGIWVGQSVVLPFAPERPPLFNISGKETPNQIKADFTPFWQAWDKVTTEYLERNKLDPQDLIYGAISGMVRAIGDPYTVFLDPQQNSEFELSLSGTYEGVGIELDVRDEQLVVVAPIDGTPAQKAGVKAGDKILEIDGTDTRALTIQEAVQKIRGEKNTDVVLKLQRNGKTLDIKITRARIVIESVKFEDLGGKAAKIQITRFGDNTLPEWSKAVNKFVAGNYKKLVLDLRNNPGGRLDLAISISADFVDKGTITMLEEEASGKQIPFKTESVPRLKNIETVVLINEGSASASEIVAGALRDILGTKLVGQTSFGKGTIQRVDGLPKGAGLHITFAKWLTPKGTWVNKKGLKPDVQVKLTDKDIAAKRDPQLSKALQLLK